MSKKKLIIIGLATLVLVNMFDVFESAPVPGALLNALLIVAIAALAYLLRTEGLNSDDSEISEIPDGELVPEENLPNKAAEEIEKKEFAICYKCKNFKNLEPAGPRKNIWYNHLCMAIELPKEKDPVTGKVMHYSYNDLGGKYYADRAERFPHCRTTNKDGSCGYYEKKRNRIAKIIRLTGSPA